MTATMTRTRPAHAGAVLAVMWARARMLMALLDGQRLPAARGTGTSGHP